MITYKYSANYTIDKHGDIKIISRDGVIRLPRLINVSGSTHPTYTTDRIIHNKIKWLLDENIEIPFDYTIHSQFDSNEYINLLTGMNNTVPYTNKQCINLISD